MIWRVFVQWSYAGLNFTCERGARADSLGHAVDLVLSSLRADRADWYRVQGNRALSVRDFTEEARALPLVNAPGVIVREAFS
jgi:hypothetical protein